MSFLDKSKNLILIFAEMWISKPKLLVTLLFLTVAPLVNAKTDESSASPSSNPAYRSGVKVYPVPIVSYDSDLGWRFGAAADLYNFGKNPSYYPLYKQRLHADASYYLRGKGVFDLNFDTSFLIPRTRFVADVSYQFDPLYSFYGLNGSLTPYYAELDKNNDRAAYSMRRNVFAAKTFFSKGIVSDLKWSAGLSYWNFYIDDTDFNGYDPSRTVYREFVDAGIIRQNEARGGNILEIQAGLAYDSRDFEYKTSNGILAELSFVGAPNVFCSGYSYLKLCAHFSQYFTPQRAGWFTLAYHLAYQGTIAGESPFYMQSQIYTFMPKSYLTEGLGGYGTLRGILTGRLLGEGYAWGNLEMRFRLFEFAKDDRELSLALVPFLDAGVIAQPARLEEFSNWTGRSVEDLSRASRDFHFSAGLGFKLGLNGNIISLDVAKPFNQGDCRGAVCICVGTNYIF